MRRLLLVGELVDVCYDAKMSGRMRKPRVAMNREAKGQSRQSN